MLAEWNIFCFTLYWYINCWALQICTTEYIMWHFSGWAVQICLTDVIDCSAGVWEMQRWLLGCVCVWKLPLCVACTGDLWSGLSGVNRFICWIVSIMLYFYPILADGCWMLNCTQQWMLNCTQQSTAACHPRAWRCPSLVVVVLEIMFQCCKLLLYC